MKFIFTKKLFRFVNWLYKWGVRFFNENSIYRTTYLLVISAVDVALEMPPMHESKERMAQLVNHVEAVAKNESRYKYWPKSKSLHLQETNLPLYPNLP